MAPTSGQGSWPGGVVPNVVDEEAFRASFSWDEARRHLDGLPEGRGLNIAHEAVDRHAARAGKVALRVLGPDGTTEVTYAQLRAATDRFARALGSLGVGPGDTVFTLAERSAELVVAALGALKARCVLSPLFPSFGPEPVRQRMVRGRGRVLVTTPSLLRRRITPIGDALPTLDHVVLVGAGDDDVDDAAVPRLWSFDDLLAAQSEGYEIPPTDPEDVALLHFTSGTTGTPKGAMHVHEAVVAHHATGFSALDLHPDDVYWCTADPGWVTGTSYGIIAPLTHGITSIIDHGPFEAERWYRILEEQRVTVWYTAPTALRMLVRAGADLARAHDLSRLRLVASVGEPLDPEVVRWTGDVFGVPAHDTWWQTETGGIMIANLAGSEVVPGSMGRPLPGVEAEVLARGEDGRAAVVDGRVSPVPGPDVDGELALRAGWPSMFRGYLGDDDRYAACFADGWYLTGDVVRRDASGRYWFVGRADDVIKSAGHLIGPFEVESLLSEHAAVVEAGVVGLPDPVAGEVVKAFVVLTPGTEASEELRRELLGFARRRLGPAVAPRDIAFVADLPHTRSGKVMRRLLRARELGLPEGDLSTLEPVR